MDPISGAMAVIPLLSLLFGGGGNNSGNTGINQLFNDPAVLQQLKDTLFGSPTATGDLSGGILGLQQADAVRNEPLKRAITTLATNLLPVSATRNGGFGDLGGPNKDGMPPPGSPNSTPSNPNTTIRLTPPTIPGQSPADPSIGGGETGPGASPRNRGLSVPSYADLLQQFRTSSMPALPALG